MSNLPSNLKYTEEHEWVRDEGDGSVTIGITDFAQSELGDIVFVELEPVGFKVDKNSVFGTVEAVKTVSELFAPLSGEIIELNSELESDPEVVNNDPYGKGWMIRLRISNPDELQDLMTSQEYAEVIG
ncbi:MAG: glycine cleavage system protein GcvH [Balneolaceae bacterium]